MMITLTNEQLKLKYFRYANTPFEACAAYISLTYLKTLRKMEVYGAVSAFSFILSQSKTYHKIRNYFNKIGKNAII